LILTLDNEYAAVLDACVPAPMPLCDTLLRCAEDPALFRALWSEEILEEVKRTLLLKFGYTSKQVDHRLCMMREAFPEASVAVPPALLAAVPQIPDEADKHVVAAAIHEGAQVIVTSNLKHFPQEVLAPHRVLVQSPDDFLIHQYHLNPDVVTDKIDTQASAIGQQRSALLDRLEKTSPAFVGLLREKPLTGW
jgi:predicted nucleic acid-binding protein